VGSSSSLDIQFLASDAGEKLAAGINRSPFEVYRVSYTPPPAPPANGTAVLPSRTVTVDAIPAGGGNVTADFGTWPIPFPGEFTFDVHRVDGVTGDAVNALHVGAAATATMTA